MVSDFENCFNIFHTTDMEYSSCLFCLEEVKDLLSRCTIPVLRAYGFEHASVRLESLPLLSNKGGIDEFFLLLISPPTFAI